MKRLSMPASSPVAIDVKSNVPPRTADRFCGSPPSTALA